jgi:hypothetical protein
MAYFLLKSGFSVSSWIFIIISDFFGGRLLLFCEFFLIINSKKYIFSINFRSTLQLAT